MAGNGDAQSSLLSTARHADFDQQPRAVLLPAPTFRATSTDGDEAAAHDEDPTYLRMVKHIS